MMIRCGNIIQSVVITKFQSGHRLDQVLSQSFPNYSRSQIKHWIIQGRVTLNGSVVIVPRKKVFTGELVKISYIFENTPCLEAQNIPLNVVYEDNHMLIINKPSNFVVYPGAGNPSGTLLNSLLYHYPVMAAVPRAGIVQRLDKDTTGLMLIAKDVLTRIKLIRLLQRRKVIREYEAIVVGNILNNGTVNEPIARHVTNRTCMAVSPYGKFAVTHYQILEKFSHYTRLKIRLETGRTHQIRVHMSHIQHPLIGDQKYGNFKSEISFKKLDREFNNDFSFHRQALHAAMLEFSHPITGVIIRCQASLPNDMIRLLEILRVNFSVDSM